MISKEQLKQIMPSCTAENLEKYVGPLNDTMQRYEINTPLRQAHFLAQVAHESEQLKHVVENLNYSQARLIQVFPRYFRTIEEAAPYNRQPEKIANRVYSNRMGNGDEASGEGWKFRGRGLIQLTGKENYKKASDAIGVDFVSNPDLVQGPVYATLTAGWYWDSRELNKPADADNIYKVTKLINGGTIGIESRELYLERAKATLI